MGSLGCMIMKKLTHDKNLKLLTPSLMLPEKKYLCLAFSDFHRRRDNFLMFVYSCASTTKTNDLPSKILT